MFNLFAWSFLFSLYQLLYFNSCRKKTKTRELNDRTMHFWKHIPVVEGKQKHNNSVFFLSALGKFPFALSQLERYAYLYRTKLNDVDIWRKTKMHFSLDATHQHEETCTQLVLTCNPLFNQHFRSPYMETGQCSAALQQGHGVCLSVCVCVGWIYVDVRWNILKFWRW